MRHDICRKVLIKFESLFLIVILLGTLGIFGLPMLSVARIFGR